VPAPDEQRLISALQAGDERAFEEAFRLYRPRLYATAVHFMGYQDAEAEDAVQDAFLNALKGIKSFEGRSSLYTWLNAICVRCCFNRLRKRKRLLASQSEDIEALGVPLAKQKHEAQTSQERAVKVAAALEGLWGTLGEACQQVLALRFKEGLDLHAIKVRLNWPLGTVSSRLARCQESLKRLAKKSKLLEKTL
jgi:RNA polymerase sigma-70 factor (ECF subfamily)